MMPSADRAPPALRDRTERAGRTLLIGAAVLLAAAGLLLWGVRGPTIFADAVLAAIAWCL